MNIKGCAAITQHTRLLVYYITETYDPSPSPVIVAMITAAAAGPAVMSVTPATATPRPIARPDFLVTLGAEHQLEFSHMKTFWSTPPSFKI
jgi:hypothetical protein